jgi:DNA-binding transcriptional LysR family regulator
MHPNTASRETRWIGTTCAIFLELARTGTLAGAARRLGVEHTTVARRIQALEKQMGAALFAREAGGHRLAEAGRHLLPAGRRPWRRRCWAWSAPRPAGGRAPRALVRVGATEGFGNLMLAPHLAQPDAKAPGPVIDLLALPRLLHLSRREADIVISLERPARGSVIVVRLTDYVLHLYGQRDYLARTRSRSSSRGRPVPPRLHQLCGRPAVHQGAAVSRCPAPPERFAFRSTSITAQYEAVRAGAGLAVLPAFLADRDPLLQRVLPGQARFTRTFWMSMPAESKYLARMQAVWGFLKETVQREQALLVPGAAVEAGTY